MLSDRGVRYASLGTAIVESWLQRQKDLSSQDNPRYEGWICPTGLLHFSADGNGRNEAKNYLRRSRYRRLPLTV